MYKVYPQKNTTFVLKVLVPGVKTVIFMDMYKVNTSMKITVLTPGTKTFNTNLVFFWQNLY